MTRFFLLMTLFLCLTIEGTFVWAHEEGAHFSGAIIEPLVTHHAHIEDEQKVNLEFVDQERVEIKDEEREFDVFRQELELAWASPNFRWGAEMKLPFSNQGEDDGERQYGPGDLEIWFPKYAWINKPETILTTLFAIHVPTGSESQGLGEGKTLLEGKIFLDQAYRNWFFGLNLESSTAVSGEFSTKFEYSGVVAYSFIREKARIAPPRPDQRFVAAPFFEVNGEVGLGGEGRGEAPVALLGGFYLWHSETDWYLSLGYRVSIGRDREDDQALLVSVGNHWSWPKFRKRN